MQKYLLHDKVNCMVKIKEIFTSIQGEGPYIGYKQLFIRFCGCNLKCAYCDTDYDDNKAAEYSLNELVNISKKNLDCHSISLTGGEPLLHVDFIKEFGKQDLSLPLYLETNGTLSQNLKEVVDYITYVAADIKLPSATALNPLWELHEEFFEIASQKELFAKVVFDEKINDFEIHKITHLCKRYNVELILQPKTHNNLNVIDSLFMQNILDKCLKIYPKVRLIPQVHKFLNMM